jgi:uncharacterized protein
VPRSGLREPPPGFDSAAIAVSPLVERDWPVTALALDVSGRCNLACRYCAEAATQPARRTAMTWQTMAAALSLLDTESRGGLAPTLRLGSGEPLLALPLLRQLDERLRQDRACGKTVPRVYLTTNGTRVDKQVANWLVDTGWQVKISLDGPRAIHDRWRVGARGKGTWKQVSAAVQLLAERMPERLSVTAVMCRDSDPAAVFAAIEALGVRRIELVPVAHGDADIMPNDDDLSRYAAFVTAWVDRLVAKPLQRPQAQPIRLVGSVRRVMGYDVKRVVCGAGRNFFGVDASGNVFPCFRFIGMSEYGLGDLANHASSDLTARFRAGAGRALEARRACSTCWAAMLCGGPCFACSEMFGPGGGEPLPTHCDYTLADAHAAVRLVNALRQNHPQALLYFLPEGVLA